MIAEEAIAVWELAERTAQSAREAVNLAQAMGTTAREVQRLEYAAKFAGVEAGVLHQTLRRLSTSAVDAAHGGAESNLVFSQLGVNIFDANGKIKNSTSLLADIADAFHRMPDGVEKTAQAVKLFGRTGPDWIPILNKGREGLKELGDEGERVGYVMSGPQLAAGKRFTELLHELEAIVQGITRSIGNRLIPIFNDLMEKLKAWYDANQEIIAQNVTAFVYFMAHSLQMLWTFADTAFKAIKALSGGFFGLKEILIIVGGLMSAFTAATTVLAIEQIIGVVTKLASAFKLAAFWNTIMTGGANLAGVAAVLAGAGAVGLLAYAAYGGSGPPLDQLHQAPNGSFGASGSVTNSNVKGGVVHQENTFHIESHGTTEAQKVEIAEYTKWHMAQTLRNAAGAAVTPTGK